MIFLVTSKLKPVLAGFGLLLFVLFTSLKASSQTITIDNSNFHIGPYGKGGNITVPIKMEGCFGQSNKFELYLSDALGNFPGVKIGEFNSFFAPFVNGQIPASTIAGSNYKLQVRSTNPVKTSNSSSAFTIGNAAVTTIKNPTTVPNLINDSIIGRCSYTSASDYDLYVTNTTAGTFEPKLLNSSGSNVALTTLTPNDILIPAQAGNYYTLQYAIKAGNSFYSIRSFLVLATTTNLSLQTSGSNEICLPDTKIYTVNTSDNGGIKLNYPGTLYTFNFGDGTPNETYTHCELIENGGKVEHNYTKTSCLQPPVAISVNETQYNAFKVNVTATNPFCQNFTPITTFAKVFEKPLASFTRPEFGCVNTTISFTNNSNTGESAPGNAQNCTNNATYQWFVNGVPRSTAANLDYVFSAPGVYTIRLVANNGSCSDDTTQTICIEPTPVPDFLMNNRTDLSGCAPLTVNLTNKTNTNACRAFTWDWQVLNSTTLTAAVLGTEYTISPNATNIEPTVRFLIPGTYIIRLTINNSCGTFTKDRIVNLKLDSDVNLPANQRYCGLKTINFANSIGHIPTYNTNAGNETYEWSITPSTYSFVGGTSATSRTPQVQFNAYGVYTVKVKFTNDCNSDEATQTITFDEPLTVNAGADQIVCFNETSVSFSATNTGPIGSGQWSTSGNGTFADKTKLATTYTFGSFDKTNLSATLTFTATPIANSVCQPVSDSKIITIRPENKMSNAINSPICSGTSFTYTPVATQPGSTFTWTSSVTTGSVTGNVASGTGNITHTLVNNSATSAAVVTYTITPFKDGCNGTPSTFTVTVNPKPAISTATGTNPSSCATATGSITLSGLGNNITYSVNFNFNGVAQAPVTVTSNSSGTATISNLVAGAYSNITVSLNGCQSNVVGPVTLTDPNPPATPSASSNGPICSGSELKLSASSATAGVSYTWSGPNSFTSASQNPTIASATTAHSGVYSVVARLNNCTSLPGTVSVVVNQTPTTPTVNIPAVCVGATLHLSATATGSGTITYAWTGPNGFTSNLQNPTIPAVTAAASGTYSVIATATTGNCASAAGTATVSIKPTPVISTFSGNNPTSCASATGNIKLNGLAPGTNYSVNYLRNGAAQTASATTDGSGTLTIPSLTAGTYSEISVTLAGCTSDKVGPVTLTDPAAPAAPTVTSNGPVCSGATLTLNASTTTVGTATYNWTGPNGFTSSLQNPTIPAVTTAASGTYSVTATINGCRSTAGTVSVVINQTPLAPAVNSNAPICTDQTLNLTANSSTPGALTYAWTGPNSFTSNLQNPTISNVTSAATGTYNVTATLAGCTSTPSTTSVTIKPTPEISGATPADPTSCATATGSITLNGLTAGRSYVVSYLKNGAAQSVTMSANAGGSLVIPSLTAGTYSDIYVTLEGCISNKVGPYTLKDPNPPAEPTITTNSPVCSGSTLELRASSATAGVSYTWIGPGGYTSSLQNPDRTNVTTAASGTYTVTVTLSNCTASKTVTVAVNPAPAMPNANSVSYCLNATATPLTATATAGHTLLWYTTETGGTGSAAAPTPSTTTATTLKYYVSQVATATGCEGPRKEVLVVVDPAIGNNLISSDQTLCAGTPAATIGQASGSVTGGNGTYTYQWQQSTDNGTTWTNIASANGASYAPGVPAATTKYRRIVTSNLCTNTSNEITISVQGNLTNIEVGSSQTICAGTAPAALTGTAPAGGTGTFTYQWYSSPDNSTWSPIASATTPGYQPPVLNTTTYYRRKVTSGSCEAYSTPVTITVNPKPVITQVDNKIFCADAASGAINFTASPGTNVTYAWTNDNTAIGLAGSGSGNIASFTTTNTGTPKVPVKGTITVTPTYTNNSVGCAGSPMSFSIVVLPKISIDAISNEVVCTGTPIAALTPVHDAGSEPGSVISYKWTVTGQGISLVNGSGSQIPAYTTLNTGTSDLVATITVTPVYTYNAQSCEGAPRTYTVTVKSATPAASAGADRIVCAVDEISMTAVASSGATGVWRQIGTPAATIVSPNSPTTKITGLVPNNTYEFEWTVSGFASCPSTKDTVVIINRPEPTVAKAGNDVELCNFDAAPKTVLLNATVPAHAWEKGAWTIESNTTGTTPVFSNAASPTSTITNIALGAGINAGEIKLTWKISNDGGCAPSVDTAVIYIYRKPSAGTLAPVGAVCQNSTVNVTLNNHQGRIIKWRIRRAPFNSNDYKDSLVTVPALLFNSLQDSIMVQAIVGSVNPGCNLFDTSTLLVPVHLPSIGGKTGSDATYCIGSATGNVTLSDYRGDITWEQSTNNGSSWTTVAGQTSATLSYTNLSVSTWYRARVQNGVCAPEVSTITKITVVPSTGAANAGPDQTICNGESTLLTGNIVAGVTYTWTQIGGATLTTSATDKSSLTISGMQPGQSYTFEYQISNGICPPAKDTIVILNAEPVVNMINKRIDSVCVGTTYNTNSPAATGGNHAAPAYQWQSSVNGVTYSDIPGATAISYSFTTATTTWLIRKATIGPCVTTSDTIIVRVIPNPDAANAGADLALCYVESAELKGNNTTTGVMTWKKLSATGATIDDEHSAETRIRNLLPAGALPVRHEFEYAIDNGICPARKDTVSVVVYPQLINKITPLEDTICNSQTVTLRTAVLSGGNGTYNYQWQQSIDGVTFTNMAGHTAATLTFIPSQSLYLRRVVTSLPCEVYSDTAFIVVQAAIDNNQISASADVCINTAPATIKGSLPTGGNSQFIYSWERSTDNGATWTPIAGATSQDYTSGPLTVDTRFRRIVSTNLCAGPQASISNVVIMTVRPDARAVFNPNPTIACPPFHITSSVVGLQTFPAQNRQYEWYANDVLIGTGINFPGYTLATDGDSVNIKLKAISLYGCLNDSISQYLYSQPLPRPAFDMSTSEGCGPLDVKFTNTTPRINSFTYKWDFGNGQTSTLAQPGTIVFPPNPTYGDTTYKVSFTVFSICDTVSIEKTVRVKSKPKALFTPTKTIGCSPLTVEFTNTSLGIGNTYKWDFGDGTVVTASKREPITHTFHTAERDTFYVRLTATNECGDDVQEYAIVVTPNTIRLDFAINGNEHLGCAPHPVRFINNTTGATSFRWDFGDGNILSTTKNIDTVTHSYLTPGTYLVKLLATNGCSDTATTESITVFNKPVPAYTIDKHTVCIGDKLRFTNSSSDATSYLWKFGDGNVSTVVNPTHHYTKAGTYNVVLIAYRTSAPGVVCTDSIQQQVNVLSSMPGNFEASSLVGNCIPFTVTFTNKHQPSMVTTWDFGDGKTATGDVVTHTYTKPGNFTVSMSATVPEGCTYVATKVVQVNGPYGEMKYVGGVVCNNDATRFEATVVNTDKLVWNFGDGTTLTTSDRIVFHTYAHAGKYVPSVTLQSNTGCNYPIKGTDTLYVDKIKAGYQYTENKVCGTTTLHFRDTSHVYFGKKSITWDFGDGTTGTGPNPSHTYTASGTYTVQMTITGMSGCVETVTRQLNIAVYDKPVVDIVVKTKPCTNQAIEFVANIAAIDPISHIQWTLSNGVKGTGNPFKAVFNTPGNYSIQVIVGTVNGCFDTASVNFTVDPSPVITASPDVILCRGGSTNLSVTGATQYAWSPLNDISCTTCPNPRVSPLTTTPYVVTGTNSFGCSDWDTVVVTVMQPFKMNVSPNDSICIGSSSLLQASGASSYRWSPATGLSSTTIPNPIATPSVTTTYRVVGYDGFNCFTDTAFVVVAVGQYPTVELGPDLTLSTGTLQPLSSTVQNGPIRTWEWKPATDLSCANCPLPVAHIKKDITYTVKVTTPYGCSDTDTLSIKTFCESAQVFVPNAFTPDGDGINDIAMVRGKGIVTVKTFRIFNRWGEVVFERNNFPPNETRHGWDGKVKGVIGGPDVFVYTAEVVCENGTTYTYKGNISIIK